MPASVSVEGGGSGNHVLKFVCTERIQHNCVKQMC